MQTNKTKCYFLCRSEKNQVSVAWEDANILICARVYFWQFLLGRI